jgi:cytochrome c1
MRKFLLSTIAAGLLAAATPALAHEGPALEKQEWSWLGVFGQYDKAQLRRGWQVYHDICSNCHSLKLVAYRNLSYLGFSDDEIKDFAAEKQVTDGPNDQGEMYQRPARAADHFVPPFANEQAARVANNGALPPDLSLMAKARNGGPDYIFAILTGFEDTVPEGHVVPDGMYYNKAFNGGNIGMPPPISDDAVTYTDGTKATKEQIAKDVVSFLNWTAEPELDVRHSLGIKVLGFLVVLTAMFYALKRKIWADVH